MIVLKKLRDSKYKLEELRMVINYPYIDNRIKEYPSTLVYNDFKLFKKVNTKMSDNSADNILIVLSNTLSNLK